MVFPGMCVLASGVDRLMDSRRRTIPAVNGYSSAEIPMPAFDFRDSLHCLRFGEPLPSGLKQQAKPQHATPVPVARLGMWLVTFLILRPP
jgi:hypothetical protein